MTTKTTTKSPAAKTTTKAKAPKVTKPTAVELVTSAVSAPAPKRDAGGLPFPTFEQLTSANIEAGKVALATVMPKLVAKYGTPNPAPVEGVRFKVDPACSKEYVTAKAGLLRDILSRQGLSLHRAPMVHIEVNEEQAMSKIEEQKTEAQKSTTAKASKAKHEQVVTPHGEFRKGSVLHAIYRAFELKGGATKAEILERLVKEFPDRTAEDMSSTVNTQINRMPKEREFTLGRSDAGRYGLHIEGVSKVRILSPEAAAKIAARQEAKAIADAAKAEEKAAAKAKAEADVAEAAKKAGVTVNVPNATVVGKAAKKATTK